MAENTCCAFTGHRNLFEYDFDGELLDRVIRNLILNGANRFLCGMAVGFDMCAAESVIKYKRQYEISLTACVPCANQSDFYSEKNKQRYDKILACCDDVITLAPEYFKGCMHGRDRYMVDNCDILVCFLRKSSGGTFYTVNYARKAGKKIIEL